MAYRFRIRGQGFRHSWEKECTLHVALIQASEVAVECARDGLYEGAMIRVADEAGREIAIVPVSNPPERIR